MYVIKRDIEQACKKKYDLIIIGGGIYGAMLSLEASRRGLVSMILEKGDFGEQTSFNSLRIIHGGLRYLKNIDLHRYRESVDERSWFLRTFPEHVKPLPCLMPLYGEGFYRPSVFRTALKINEYLSSNRNKGIRKDRKVPSGKIIDKDETHEIFPAVETERLVGGALWYDGFVQDSQRLLIDIIRWSCGLGATALNYIEVKEIRKINSNVSGMKALDHVKGKNFEFETDVIINAAGPWCRKIASEIHEDEPRLFKPSLAWNVLFDKKALSDYALALTQKKKGGRIFFIVPWKEKIFAGTGHEPWIDKDPGIKPMPTKDMLQVFLGNLNSTIPGLNLELNDILRVYSGLLPATEMGKSNLASREVIVDHGKQGGPSGFYSISGVKFTTSRLVSEKTLDRIFPDRRFKNQTEKNRYEPPVDLGNNRGVFDIDWYPEKDDESWKKDLKKLYDEESVIHIDDLIFRRTTLGDIQKRAKLIAPEICQILNWDEERSKLELKILERAITEYVTIS